MSYTPPNKHNVYLNFEQISTPQSRFNLVLNFGANIPNLNQLNARIDTRISVQVSGTNTEIFINRGQLNAQIDTRVSAKISGLNWENVDNRGRLQASLCTDIESSLIGINDINHLVGVSYDFNMRHQKAIACLSTTEIPWAKPVLRVSNEALFYDHGLVISNQKNIQFEQAGSLNRAIRSLHEQTTGLSSDAYVIWEEGDKRFIHQRYLHEETIKLRHNRETVWQEMIRRRKTFTYSHEVAQVFEHRFSFEWDKGLEIVTKSDLPWDKANAIHYRKHPVKPWPKPIERPKRQPVILNFCCHSNQTHRFNVELNFKEDKCAKSYLPAIPNQNWWYILNSLSVTRLDNDAEILVYDGNYRSDRSSWAWSYSLTVPHTEITKLEPINGQPVILKIMVNGHEHHMLLENRTRSRNFGNITYTLTGRSQTALLDAPYAPLRSFLQENERTSVQLAQAELDRVFSDTVLNWQLIDDLGWIVANNSLSYSNLAPIAAIKLIAESGGGFIYSEKGSNTLSIKPLYKKTFWDTFTVDDYDRLVPDSLVTSQSTDYELYPDYNGITLTNDRTGKQGQVKRTGTAADVLLPPENNPLFDVVSMGAFGKAKLAKAGMIETHTLTMPISAEVGECAPGEVFAFNAQWWGIVESVSVSFSHAKVNQTVKVERVNRE